MLWYIAAAIFALYWLTKKRKRPLSWIPGPSGLPLLGNILQIDTERPHHSVTELAGKYGPVYKISMLGLPIVVVSGQRELHEVFVKKGQDFAGRMKNFLLDHGSKGYKSVINSDPSYREWQDMKKLLFSHIKGYGAGIKRIEALTISSINDMIHEMKNSENISCFDLISAMNIVVLNITHTLVLGTKLTDSEEREKIISIGRLLGQVIKPGIGSFWLNQMPLLRYLGHPTWKEDKPELMIMDDHVMMNAVLLFNAGTLTTAGTLSSLFHILADNTHIQQHIHAEVDNVLKDRDAAVEDKVQMPYLQACIYETLRLVPIAPLAVVHSAMRDTAIGHLPIPEGTIVWPNIWALHHDQTIWEAPYEFRPERFLDAEGQLVAADHPSRKNIMAFGAGPRVCAGETFAMTRMFLILAQMMKNFEILPVEGQTKFDCRNMVTGVALRPAEFRVQLKPRRD